MQMKIDTSGANKVISEAIIAVGECYTYEDLRLITVNLIAVTSHLVGCIEGMQGDTDDES